MSLTEGTVLRSRDVSTSEGSVQKTSRNTSQTIQHTAAENPIDTAAFITLVRRAPALAALREQPLDRRDLEERLGVSKPTVHRLTRTLGEMGLVEKSTGLFVLTELGEAVADVVAEFTRNVGTAYRLAPLLASFHQQSAPIDVGAFAGATVTTAEPGDPYRPVRRYYSLIERTDTLRGFDTTMISPEYIGPVHEQIRDGMQTAMIYEPDVVARLLSAHPEQMAETFESNHLVLRVHPDLPHGLAIFDDGIGVMSYCETTGAPQAFVEANSSAACEWAETAYESYLMDAERFEWSAERVQHL